MSYLTNVSAFLPLRISPVILSLKLKVRGRQLMEKKKWTEGRALGKTGLHPWLCVPGLSHGRLLLTQDLLTFDPLSKHLEGKPHKMYTCREKKKEKKGQSTYRFNALCIHYGGLLALLGIGYEFTLFLVQPRYSVQSAPFGDTAASLALRYSDVTSDVCRTSENASRLDG